jgi:hypothetical protein
MRVVLEGKKGGYGMEGGVGGGKGCGKRAEEKEGFGSGASGEWGLTRVAEMGLGGCNVLWVGWLTSCAPLACMTLIE